MKNLSLIVSKCTWETEKDLYRPIGLFYADYAYNNNVSLLTARKQFFTLNVLSRRYRVTDSLHTLSMIIDQIIESLITDHGIVTPLYSTWSDVTQSVVTIRSPFCGYSLCGIMYGAKPCYVAKICPVIKIKLNQFVLRNCQYHDIIINLYQQSVLKRYQSYHMLTIFNVLPTRWRQKPAGIDKIGSNSCWRLATVTLPNDSLANVTVAKRSQHVLVMILCPNYAYVYHSSLLQ